LLAEETELYDIYGRPEHHGHGSNGLVREEANDDPSFHPLRDLTYLSSFVYYV
jgi:hypothetical protein